MSTDPAVDAAAWASFEQDVAAGNAALDELVDHIAAGLDNITSEELLAGLVIMLNKRGHDTLTSIAALAVVRLARIRHRR